MLKYVMSLQEFLSRPLREEDRGASAVEYGLLVFFIAIVIIAAVMLLGNNLSTLFNTVATAI